MGIQRKGNCTNGCLIQSEVCEDSQSLTGFQRKSRKECNVNFHVNVFRGLSFSGFQGVRINYQLAKAKIIHGKRQSNRSPLGVKFMKLILN